MDPILFAFVSDECTEAILYDEFVQFGPVAMVRICRDSVSRRSLGYAYIHFLYLSDGKQVQLINKFSSNCKKYTQQQNNQRFSIENNVERYFSEM